jgi:N-acetyl-gamma-glutamyl-phosphate reductase
MCKIAKMVKVAIVGASGYTGAELMRICASHPSFEVVVATARSHEDQRVADVYPSLSKAYGEMR